MQKIIIFIVVFISPLIAGYETLMYDRFADGERVSQSLPDSARWFTKMPPESVFTSSHGLDYRIETAPYGVQQVWCHFTPAGQQVCLESGEQIRLRVVLEMLSGSDASWDRGLMLGLFNSMGTRDETDGTYSSANRNDDNGFFIITNPGKTTYNYAKLCMVTENTSSDHFVNYTVLNTFTSYNMSTEAVDISFDILRVPGGLKINSVIGPYSSIYDEFIPIEDGSDYLCFDTISLFLDGRAFPGDIGAFGLDFAGVYLYRTDACSETCGYGNRLAGDINRDCYVNIIDFYVLSRQWLWETALQ
ncbi:hypothetical protein SMSP2_01408 [Limihaloglobus sulfuriphilus]|uniref:Dockerin domain-containing protein n=1 Tax=Limihaloglobus sulfuriphilus TaxID=1851148 RepID=A0A1Q2MEG7_9BACT|nr:hypothetical protein [Limihaloglobus sulfuriphilus]AQQ71044.1 hypothetical protein SMSP2_01408 [Limihaloglobus sulfuriphilus]